MADDAPPPPAQAGAEPPGSRASQPRPWRHRKRTALIGAGAAATALALLLLAAAVTRPGSEHGAFEGAGGPLKAAIAADRVPKDPAMTSIPQGCGVSDEVLRQLAPQAGRSVNVRNDHSAACTWEERKAVSGGGVGVGGGEGARTLEVRIREAHGELYSQFAAASSAMADYESAAAAALRATGRVAPDRPRTVSGLGDEAVAVETAREDVHENPVRETDVIFRTGHIVVQVEYGGWDHSGGDGPARPPKPRALDAATARAGAFMAAEDIAENMKLTRDAAPALAPERPRQPVLGKVPEACGLLSRQEAERAGGAGPGAHRYGPRMLPTDAPGVHASGCSFGRVKVEVVALDDTASAGGVETARREYLRRYHDCRHDGPSGTGRDAEFSPLAGPGEEAFVTFGRHELGGGEVQLLFRVRNALVRIDYFTGEAGSVPGADHAYELARAAAARLPR